MLRTIPLLTALAAALLFAAGCATKPLPLPYVPEAEHAKIVSPRMLILVPSFDDRPQKERALLDPKFSASAYVDDMLAAECAASGLTSEVATFPHAPDFAGVAAALQNSPASEGSLVLAAALQMMPGEYVFSCDVALYSNTGEPLFEKRGICIIMAAMNAENMKRSREVFYGGKPFAQDELDDLRRMSARMAMRQIFSDPAFIKAVE
jgi:hypothetical protein